MTHALQALTAEPWAIRPDYLRVLVSLATLDRDQRGERRAAEGQDWHRRDLALFTGPSAQMIEGARYAMLTADGVALIPIFGPIFPRANMMTEMSGGVSAAMLASDIRTAQANPDVGAIMLLVDSPGGSPTGINALADQIFAMRRGKRMMAHVTGACASAAYWLASSAHEIVTEKTGLLGCIGVVAAMQKQVEPNAAGEMTFEIVSSNAPDKRPDPTTEEGSAPIRAMLDAIEGQFIDDVARGRGVTATKVKSDFGAGGVKMGADAVAAGMADRVQSYERSYSELARTAKDGRTQRQARRL